MSRYAICAQDGSVVAVIATTDADMLDLNTPAEHAAIPVPNDVLVLPESSRWNGTTFEAATAASAIDQQIL